MVKKIINYKNKTNKVLRLRLLINGGKVWQHKLQQHQLFMVLKLKQYYKNQKLNQAKKHKRMEGNC